MEQSQIQMEAALIGAVIRNRDVFDGLGHVKPDDFIDIRHKAIWTQLVRLVSEGSIRVWDAQIIASESRMEPDYLVNLEMGAPRGREKPEEYAKIIAQRGHGRRIRSAADAIARSTVSHEKLLSMTESLFEIAYGSAIGGPELLSDGIEEWMRAKERMIQEGGSQFIETGFRGLDARIGGLRPGELLIVAGRPGTGKTQLSLSVAEYVARLKKPVHICNLEMLRDQMIDRMSSRQGIELARLRSPHLDPYQDELVEEMSRAAAELKGLPIWVDYVSDDIHEISSHARRMKRTEDIQLLIVDYLQLVTAEGRNRTEEVGIISRGLKRLGASLGIPVIALAQMNRDVEKRAGGRPTLSDLRESGSIEQDADFVVFLWRHAMSFNNPNAMPNEATLNVVEAITAKARQGEPGTDFMRADFAFSRFRNMEDQEISDYLGIINGGGGGGSVGTQFGVNS